MRNARNDTAWKKVINQAKCVTGQFRLFGTLTGRAVVAFVANNVCK